MREIKFRGKDIDNRLGWHYGYFFKDGNKTYISEKGKSQEVDPKTVGEFTGLYDQDKKEIYEGDIVALFKSKTDESPVVLSVIDFYKGSFGCGKGQYYLHKMLDCYSVKKIGNIYENPELLKKGGK